MLYNVYEIEKCRRHLREAVFACCLKGIYTEILFSFILYHGRLLWCSTFLVLFLLVHIIILEVLPPICPHDLHLVDEAGRSWFIALVLSFGCVRLPLL